MTTFTDRLAILITASGAGAVKELQGVGNSAEAEMGKASTSTGKFQQVVGGLIPGLGNLQDKGIGVGTALKVGVAAGATAGAAALVDFAAKGISAFESATGEVRGLQRVMGGTAEDASKLRFVAKALGVDLDAVGRGAGLLAKSIGNGTSKLKEYGIEVAHDKQGNTDMAGTIANIAQAYQSTNDPARRAAIGAAAFGRGWQQMAPILSKSKDEIQALYAEAGKEHQIFSSSDTEAGRQLSVATRELNTEVQGLEIELARGLVPAVASGTREIKDLLQAADSATGPLGGMGNVLGTLTSVMNPLPHLFAATGDVFKGHFLDATKEYIHTIPGVGPILGGFTNLLDTNAGSSQKAAQAAITHKVAEQQRKQAVLDSAAAIVKEQNALSGQLEASLSYEGSLRQLSAAEDDYRAKQLLAIAGKGKDRQANADLDASTFALKQQIEATAKAAQAKAVSDAGPNAAASDAARVGNEAYRRSLEAAATSTIPAVREQALLLIGALQTYAAMHPDPSINIDTSAAHAKLQEIETRWNGLVTAFASGTTATGGLVHRK